MGYKMRIMSEKFTIKYNAFILFSAYSKHGNSPWGGQKVRPFCRPYPMCHEGDGQFSLCAPAEGALDFARPSGGGDKKGAHHMPFSKYFS